MGKVPVYRVPVSICKLAIKLFGTNRSRFETEEMTLGLTIRKGPLLRRTPTRKCFDPTEVQREKKEGVRP